MLPEENNIFRVDDLQELSLYFVGDDDNNFGQNEEILFYGQSPHTWEYNEKLNVFNHIFNRYSEQTYYFIKIDNASHKIVQESGYSLDQIESSPQNEINNIYSFQERVFYENDLYNLVAQVNLSVVW